MRRGSVAGAIVASQLACSEAMPTTRRARSGAHVTTCCSATASGTWSTPRRHRGAICRSASIDFATTSTSRANTRRRGGRARAARWSLRGPHATESATSSAAATASSTGMPWALYLPRDTQYTLTRSRRRRGRGLPAHSPTSGSSRVLVTPEDVEIEVRGSGNATRQINHIIKPEFPGAASPRCRSVHPRGQLVELPAAQARRGRPTRRGRARGGLLLPHAERAARRVRRAAAVQPAARHRRDARRCATATSCSCRTATTPPRRRTATTSTT